MTVQYPIVDTHTHLCDAEFDLDRGKVIDRARSAGLSSIVTIGENLADANRNMELAYEYPELRPGAGLYPTYTNLNQAEEMVTFVRCEKDRLYAIGEVGLDYWKVQDESDREIQREIFRTFIDLSLDLGIPLNVHSRSAGRHAIDFLLKHSASRVQFHAFDGKASSALPAVEAGFFFSIPPSVVRSAQKQKLVRMLPLSHILIETDSPVLGPTPGERNEPANALASVQAIAEMKNMHEEEVVEAVIQNTSRLYGDGLNTKS